MKTWLEVLAGDPKAIFTAAKEANRACEFLHELVA